jgi:hypothetical protein
VSVRKQLGYSPLTRTIHLAKMRTEPSGLKIRVGNEKPEDVTNEAAQMVYQLVTDEGGEICWTVDGIKHFLKAGKNPTERPGR